MSLNTTPRTWVAGETVTATQLNTEVRDALAAIQAAWTSYTPTWTASTTNPTLGNGTISGAYLRIGKTFFFRVRLAIGTTTTAGSGTYTISLPASPITGSNYVLGQAFLSDSGGSLYSGVALYVGDAGGTRVYYNTATGTAAGWTSSAAPFTLGSSDNVTISGCYEAA